VTVHQLVPEASGRPSVDGHHTFAFLGEHATPAVHLTTNDEI